MKKTIKHLLYTILVIFIFIIPLCIAPIVKADSGWDSSYDSGGGSWDSGGDSWDSGGGSWDYDSNSSYSGSGSAEGDFVIFVIFFTIFVIVILISLAESKTTQVKTSDKNKYIMYSYQDITDDFLQNVLPEEQLENLKELFFTQFIDIQTAWMNFDYKELRNLCTDELYNSYKSQLETLKLKNGQNIMHGFEALDIRITNIENINGEIIANVFLAVQFYDYVINTKTDKITRGNNYQKIFNNYEMTFVMSAKPKKQQKCPNCGALNKHITSGECEYCHSTLITKASKFVLSSKKNVNK